MLLKTKMPAIAAAPLLLTALCTPLSAQTAAETFAKAKRIEINQAQAKQALPLYELVAQSPKATDTLKAGALYRLSICYLKLEEYKKASVTLTRIENTYPRSDQAVQARLLRKTLGASEKVLEPRRDLRSEVQNLLVEGTTGTNWSVKRASARTALKSLLLIGSPANPVLREALDSSDSDISNIALAALVQNGDIWVGERLLRLVDSETFEKSITLLYRSPSYFLLNLCIKQPELWQRVAKAFELSEGEKKARLLKVMGQGRQLRLDSAGYRDLLRIDNERVRSTAWDVYEMSIDRKDPGACRKYVATLLALWDKHDGYRESLGKRLADAFEMVSRAGEPLSSKWAEVLVEAARTGTPGLELALWNNFSPAKDLRLPLRKALLAMPFKKYAQNALLQRPRGVVFKKADYKALVQLALRQSKSWIPVDPKHAVQILPTASGFGWLAVTP
jgi:hypothetical protein